MKLQLFRHEIDKQMRLLTNDPGTKLMSLEIGFYKRLLEFFVLGDSYYFILNNKTLEFEFISKEVESVMGYHPSEISLHFIIEKIHPRDRAWFLTIGARIKEFLSILPVEKLMNYKLRYDFRMMKKNGTYARMLYQGVIVEHTETGGILRTIGLYTDITHLKQESRPVMSFIGIDGEPSYLNIAENNVFIESKKWLTRREKQVLTLLIEGKSSKEIGIILKISKQTVDSHRKNMLHKNNLINTGELIGKAIRYGWI